MSQVTVTLPIGAGASATALALTNVSGIEFDLAAKVLRVKQSNPSKITEFDFAAAATVTYTISGDDSTVVVSS